MKRAAHLRIARTKPFPHALCGVLWPKVINQVNMRTTFPVVIPVCKIALVKIEKVPVGLIGSEENVP